MYKICGYDVAYCSIKKYFIHRFNDIYDILFKKGSTTNTVDIILHNKITDTHFVKVITCTPDGYVVGTSNINDCLAIITPADHDYYMFCWSKSFIYLFTIEEAHKYGNDIPKDTSMFVRSRTTNNVIDTFTMTLDKVIVKYHKVNDDYVSYSYSSSDEVLEVYDNGMVKDHHIFISELQSPPSTTAERMLWRIKHDKLLPFCPRDVLEKTTVYTDFISKIDSLSRIFISADATRLSKPPEFSKITSNIRKHNYIFSDAFVRATLGLPN